MNAFKSSRLIISLFLGLLLASCVGGKAQPILPRASMRVGEKTLEVELARSQDEQAMGLMFRKSLAEGKGMLFIFPQDKQLSFWMKNTSIPLSIAYISSSGKILDIFDMEPFSEAPVKTEHYARYALEVPQGYFEKHGVQVGDSVSLPGKP